MSQNLNHLISHVLNRDIPKTRPELLEFLYDFQKSSNSGFLEIIEELNEEQFVKDNSNLILKMKESCELFEQLFLDLEKQLKKDGIHPPVASWAFIVPKIIRSYMSYMYCFYSFMSTTPNSKAAFNIGFSTISRPKLFIELYPKGMNVIVESIMKLTDEKHVDYPKLSLMFNETFTAYEEIESANSDGVPKRVDGFILEPTLPKFEYGCFAYVVKGSSENALCHAISKVSERSISQMQKIQFEIDANKLLKHRHILRMRHFIEHELFYYLFWPTNDGNSLKDLINRVGPLIEEAARPVFRHIILGLQHIHSNGIIHGNINPEVIMYYNETIRISSFIHCIFANKDEMVSSIKGCSIYCAPETFMDVPYNGFLADIWSIGVILFEMVAGKPPFKVGHNEKMSQSIRKGLIVYPKTFSSLFVKLLKGILCQTPNDRLSIEQILSHPWMLLSKEVPVPVIFDPNSLSKKKKNLVREKL